MIRRNRIDYVLMAREETNLLLGGRSDELFMPIVLGDLPRGNHRYLLCGKSLIESLMTRLNTAIAGE